MTTEFIAIGGLIVFIACQELAGLWLVGRHEKDKVEITWLKDQLLRERAAREAERAERRLSECGRLK